MINEITQFINTSLDYKDNPKFLAWKEIALEKKKILYTFNKIMFSLPDKHIVVPINFILIFITYIFHLITKLRTFYSFLCQLWRPWTNLISVTPQSSRVIQLPCWGS